MNKKYKKEQNNHLHVCERKSENSSSSFIQYISWQHVCMLLAANVFTQSIARHTYKVEKLIENQVLYFPKCSTRPLFHFKTSTLESVISTCRAGNKRRAWKIWQK